MLFQIHLSKGASYALESYFVESDSKENALSYLYLNKLLNLDNYSTILVVDMSKQILKDDISLNILNAEICSDFNSNNLDRVLKYTDIFNQPKIFLDNNPSLTLFDGVKMGVLTIKNLVKHYKDFFMDK